MEKLKMQTANKADENFKKPEAMLPNAVIETINENGEVVQASDKNKPKIDLNELPEWQVKQFCRALYDACKRYYSDPENVRKYEEWKASGLTIQEWSEKQKQHRDEAQC